MNSAGIYIHLPFCSVKCMYCDFYSITDSNDRIEDFINSLISEIRLFKLQKYSYKWKFDTLFLGGGTPSLISPHHIEKILIELDLCYDLSNIKEFTIEANPGEISKEHLTGYKTLGINRLSIGFQSLNDKLLQFLGRPHSSDDAIQSYSMARDIGFDNINIDMIFDIPGQSISRWESDINKIIKLEPNHISAYSLTVERGTKLYNLVSNNKVIMPNEETDISMFTTSMQLLEDAEYSMYEISNYSKQNSVCMHNMHYWNNDPYLAFGPSSHGHDTTSRWWNHRSLDNYIRDIKKSRLPISNTETLTPNNKFNEAIYNGLRIRSGVRLKKIENIIDIDINRFINKSLKKWPDLTFDGEYLRLKKSGILLTDEIASDLMIAE